MAIDYSAAWDPLYRKKNLTGFEPSTNMIYAGLAPVFASKLDQERQGAAIAEARRRTDLASRELDITERQAKIQNATDLAGLGVNAYQAYKYMKPSEGAKTNTGLAPGAPQNYNITDDSLLGPSAAAPTMPAPGYTWSPPSFTPQEASLASAPGPVGAGGAAGTPAAAGGGGAANSLAPVNTVNPATSVPPAASTSAFAVAPDSLAGSMGSNVATGAVTAGAGIVGGLTGGFLGQKLAKATGMHEKTASDVGSAIGTFAMVTLATGNPVIGLAAGFVSGIISMF